MIGYGALLNSDMMDNFNSAWNSFSNALEGVPFYWYVAALVGMFVFFKLLTTKR